MDKKLISPEITNYVNSRLLAAQKRGEPSDQLEWIQSILPKALAGELSGCGPQKINKVSLEE